MSIAVVGRRAARNVSARAAAGPLNETDSGLGDEPARITVLIPARDEVAVLPALLADLAANLNRSTTRSPVVQIMVVDDASTDGTGTIAEAAIASLGMTDHACVVRRLVPARTKGEVLATIMPAELNEIVVVLDADARIGPDFIHMVSDLMASGTLALTARRRATSACLTRRWLIRAQDDEQTVDGAFQAGRHALGGCSEFRGNGIALRRDLLVGVGGWPLSVTEDLDLASRLAA
ncbi:MAG TPA: glycosyltransferase family 2 protein, partial [Candidatus Acidoferrum sp.]|nr:glycosyltransferase family 2 protein [Candidatus Acidoferrum sp.]